MRQKQTRCGAFAADRPACSELRHRETSTNRPKKCSFQQPARAFLVAPSRLMEKVFAALMERRPGHGSLNRAHRDAFLLQVIRGRAAQPLPAEFRTRPVLISPGWLGPSHSGVTANAGRVLMIHPGW